MRSAHWRGRGACLAAIVLCPLAAASVAPAAGHTRRARVAALYNLLANPHAAFLWFPQNPHPGEPVLLASVSSDPISPLIAWAWDMGQGGGFEAGSPTRYTSFSTFAPQVVRLRVSARDGLSDVAAEAISMSAPPASVLRPFPLVRILSSIRHSGVRIRVLAVKAGAGARITVSCRGHRCPLKSTSALAPPASRASRWTTFRRLERFLADGVVLEVRVWAKEKIGSYTRYAIRHHRLPARVDSCLDPAGTTPIACPTS
jgi:hypothetical protein